MGTHKLPDMCALIPQACGPQVSGIHIRQITHSYNYYNYLLATSC